MKNSKVIIAIAAVLSLTAVAAAIALCAAFPNKYAAKLNAAAEEFGLDGSLVRAVVWTESKFDRKAVSDKGASGLMQIMPDTLAECATALGIQSPDPFDAETSLRCGCYYLRLMIDKFDGDETAALMAYNAGEANAKKFLSGEEIFTETKNYIKRVGFAKKIYDKLTVFN